jgi:hypothetical protein
VIEGKVANECDIVDEPRGITIAGDTILIEIEGVVHPSSHIFKSKIDVILSHNRLRLDLTKLLRQPER